MQIDCDFPGGNILVDSIDGDTALVRQDHRDTEGFWFYWHMRVREAAGRTVQFQFTDGKVIGVNGPAVSLDEGVTWRWLGRENSTQEQFTYAFGPEDHSVRFWFGMCYTQCRLDAFLKRLGEHPALQPGRLCESRKGRAVELFRVGRPDGETPYAVAITCRHHACEMMASYTMEGLIEAALGDDEVGRWLQQNVQLLAVPFVDKDGVEDGDQGKNRRPFDHNRDYIDAGIYPETRAIRELLSGLAGGRLAAAIDLHCPWIRGEFNEFVYQVGSQNPELWAEQQDFGRILESVRRGPLPYRAENNLPFGRSWNVSKSFSAGRNFAGWAGDLDRIRLATSLEIPYANASGEEVTADSARALGRDLAVALVAYLAG